MLFRSTVKLRSTVRERLLVSLKLSEPEAMLWHGESVLRGTQRVGHVSSGGYGYTLGAPVGLAWIHSDEPITEDWLRAEPLQVEIRDRAVMAVASIHPFYEPATPRS